MERQTKCSLSLMSKFLRNTRSSVWRNLSVSGFFCDCCFFPEHFDYWILLCLFSSNRNKKSTSIPNLLSLDDPPPSFNACCYHLASIPFWFSLTSLSCIPGCTVAHLETASSLDPSEGQQLGNFLGMWMQWPQFFEKGPALPLLGKCSNHSAIVQQLHFSHSL